MIDMTKIAVGKFNELRRNAENPDDRMLRISLEGIGWDGPKLKLTLEKLKRVNDKVIETSGVKVVYALDIETYLGEVNIDYSDDWSNHGFIIGSTEESYC